MKGASRCIWLALTLAAFAAAEEPAPVFTCTIGVPVEPHKISPDIYGLAAASGRVLTNWCVPLNRWGGNTADTYNWKLGNAWNTGRDWFFENVAIEPHAWQNFLDRSEKAGARVFFNLPLISFVAKDTVSHSFSIRKYGPQQQHDQWRPDAGNGVRPDGKPVSGNDRYDTAVVANPEFVAEWVRAMKAQFPKLFAERRIVFALGNEPMLWNVTHRDVHPDPVSYEEYLGRFVNMARVVKTAAPEAEIAGPELWGWPAYTQSALDRELNSNADRRRHGGTDFLPWFLQQLRVQERQTGQRLLDYVTVHFYPQADGVYSPSTDLAATRLRLETVRLLWDAGYRDPSWINANVELIPQLQRWVAQNYPGTKIGLTEYNWGGEEDISGALALADILGVFGRTGLDLACHWTTPPEGSFAAAAYALFRNVDGRGARFGDEALAVIWVGDAPENITVYAARDPAAGVVTVIAINKSGLARTVQWRWNGIAVGLGRGYAFNTGGPRLVALPDAMPADGSVCLPPRSAVHLRFEWKR